MLTDERKKGIRERLERLHRYQLEAFRIGDKDDIQDALIDCRDLLAALEEMEVRVFALNACPKLTPEGAKILGEVFTERWKASFDAAEARHVQELAAKDTTSKAALEHAERMELSALRERDEARAELARTREALRKLAIDANDSQHSAEPLYISCAACDGEGPPNGGESHNPVTLTINGVETTGPCPAKLPDTP